MEAPLRALLDKLGLRWTDADLTQQLRPYELGAPLGHGSTASAFEGRSSSQPEATLVIKLPRVPDPHEFGPRWETRTRALVHEGRVLTLCSGIDGVVQLREDRSGSLLPHLVMERLGESLDDRVGESGHSPLDLPDAVKLLCELTAAVTKMHAVGVVHGDIQARNILSNSSGGWTLIDPTLDELTTWNTHLRGSHRDILGIARTFLVAYYGVENYVDVPADEAAELEDHPELLRLLRRMLGRLREPMPSARQAARIAWKVAETDFR